MLKAKFKQNKIRNCSNLNLYINVEDTDSSDSDENGSGNESVDKSKKKTLGNITSPIPSYLSNSMGSLIGSQYVSPTRKPLFLMNNENEFASNEMVNEPIAVDYERASVMFLSFFTFISAYLFHGHIFFNLVKRENTFTFSFFEWNLLYLNRVNIMDCLTAGREWSVYCDILNPLRAMPGTLLHIAFHRIESLFLNKKGKLTVVVKLQPSWSPIKQSSSESSKFTLNRMELEMLLTQTDHPFMMYVQNLQESRLSLNVTLVAICNLLIKTQFKTNQYNSGKIRSKLFQTYDMLNVLAQLFGPCNYHTQVRLRGEINNVYEKIPFHAKRTMPVHTTLSDCLELLFPSQISFLMDLYTRAHLGCEFFKCPHCITPICEVEDGSICARFIY
jgi:hypothetical protein